MLKKWELMWKNFQLKNLKCITTSYNKVVNKITYGT